MVEGNGEMPFNYVSYVIALAKTSSNVLNRSGESGYNSLALILGENLSTLHD